MLLPAATGFGEAVLVMLRSALETTLATLVAVSLARLDSPPPPTTAVLVMVEGAVGDTLALMVIEDAPAGKKTLESVQLTVWDTTEQDHPVPPVPAGMGVRPTGNVSLTVTVPL